MPYRTQWVDPELVLEHKGVKVFHTYVNDDLDKGMENYAYTLNGYEEGFDIEYLKAFHPDLLHETVLRLAIDSGELKPAD